MAMPTGTAPPLQLFVHFTDLVGGKDHYRLSPVGPVDRLSGSRLQTSTGYICVNKPCHKTKSNLVATPVPW